MAKPRKERKHCAICHTTRSSHFHGDECEACNIPGLCHFCAATFTCRSSFLLLEEEAACGQCQRTTILYQSLSRIHLPPLCAVCAALTVRGLRHALPESHDALVH